MTDTDLPSTGPSRSALLLSIVALAAFVAVVIVVFPHRAPRFEQQRRVNE